MSVRLQAVLTPAALKRWNTYALAQLCEACTRLAVENDELQRRLAIAEANADACWEQLMEMQLQLCSDTGGQPGITKDGRLVVVPANEGAQS